MTKVLDHGYVKLVEQWGEREEGIIAAARQSTQGAFRGWDQDIKLLQYLWTHQHATPFEFCGMTIEVQAPIFVIREWQRHRTFCLAGDTKVLCVAPRGTVFQKTIKEIYELKHGRPDKPELHGNGTSKSGVNITRKARHSTKLGYKAHPNAQHRLLKVFNESSGTFENLPMLDVYDSGQKDVFLLELEKGHTIKSSKDHRFLTNNGWKRLEELTLEDEIAYKSKVATNERPIPPSLRSGIGVWTSMMRHRLVKDYDNCYICNQEFNNNELELDHVVPVIEDLKLALDESNLKPCCKSCHRDKTNLEQPPKLGKSREGIRFSKLKELPKLIGREQTYDIAIDDKEHHNFVANGIVVHNSYNEMSARYAPLPDLSYTPTLERLSQVNDANKQAGSMKGTTYTEGVGHLFLEDLDTFYAETEKLYQRALSTGIPKEIARIVLPVGRYSRMRVSGNLRNWLAFLKLRQGADAQWEIQQFADVVASIIEEAFPKTYGIYINSSR